MFQTVNNLFATRTQTNPKFDDSKIGIAFHLTFKMRAKPLEPISTTILQTLFDSQNYKEVSTEIFSNTKKSKAICGKIIKRGDVVFHCLDCEKDPSCIICQECYETGNHVGHRVTIGKNATGCCDCGDSDAWAPSGFCSDHQGYNASQSMSSISNIPEDFKQRFLEVFEKSFYFLFNLYEVLAIVDPGDIHFSGIIDEIFLSILNALSHCAEKSTAIWFLTSQLLKMKLSGNNRELYAKSSDLRQLTFNKEPVLCNFTYLECLIYYHQLNSRNIQLKLHDICIQLFLDYDFKIYLAETLIKMISFIYLIKKNFGPFTTEIQGYGFTELSSLNSQLFMTDELLIIGIDSSFFTAFLDQFGNMLKYMIDLPNAGNFYTIQRYYIFFLHAIGRQPSCLKLLYHQDFLTKIFEWLNGLNYCFKINVTEQCLMTEQSIEIRAVLLEVEYQVLQIFDSISRVLSHEEDQQKKARYTQQITGNFVNIIKENERMSLENRLEFDRYSSFHIPLYRAFGIFIKNLLDKPTPEALNNLLRRQMNISDGDLELVMTFTFKMAMRVLALSTDIKERSWEFYSRNFDFLSYIYKTAKLMFFDYDILLLQLGLHFARKQDLCQALEMSVSVNATFRTLFRSISSGYFESNSFTDAVQKVQSELSAETHPPLKQTKQNNVITTQAKMQKTDDLFTEFLKTIIMLCIDETALANVLYQKPEGFRPPKHSEFCKEVYNDVLTNLFGNHTEMEMKTIKDMLKKQTIPSEFDMESSLNEVAVFNTFTRSFQLKEELKGIYEPFIFIKDSQLMSETQEMIKGTLMSENIQPDLIAGNKSSVYDYKHPLPIRMQERIFELPLIELMVQYLLHSAENMDLFSQAVKPALKLLHMALNFALYFKRESLMRRLSDQLANQRIEYLFQEIKSNSEMVDIHIGVDNIIYLMSKIQQAMSLDDDILNLINDIEQVLNIEEKEAPSETLIREEQSSIGNREDIQGRMFDIKNQITLKKEPLFKAQQASDLDDEVLKLMNDLEKVLNLEEQQMPIGVLSTEESPKKNNKQGIQQKIASIKTQISMKRESLPGNMSYIPQDDEEIQEKMICNICKLSITPDTEYGIPAFFGDSSLYNMTFERLKQEQVASLRHQGFNEGLVDQQSFEEVAAVSLYPFMTTCSHTFHYLHKECFNRVTRGRRKNLRFVYANNLEYGCPQCKSLCNILVPKNLQQPSETKEEMIDVEVTDIKSLLDYVISLKSASSNLLHKPEPLFSEILTLESDNEVQLKGFSTNLNTDNYMLSVLDRLLGQSSRTASLGGLQYFLKHQYRLYMALKDAYIHLYRSYPDEKKFAYYEDRKTLLLRYLHTVLSNVSESFGSRDDGLLFRGSPQLKIALTATPDEFLFEVLQHIIIASDPTLNIERTLVPRVLRLYLVHKLAQVYLKKKLLWNGFQEVNFANFVNDLSLGSDSLVKKELIYGLLPSMKNIIVFMLINEGDQFNKETIQTLANDNYDNAEDQMNYYLKIGRLEVTISDLLSPGLFEYSGISAENIRIWFDSLQKECKPRGLSPYLLMVDHEVVFSFINLPDNYLDLSTTYIEKKCQMCNNYTQKGKRCVCLICGVVLCSTSCTTKITRPGNLNQHSGRYHAGGCVFLNIDTGETYLIKTPKNVEYHLLYVDKYGYMVGRNKNWKDFKIDKSRLELLKEIVMHEKLAQEVCNSINKSNQKLSDCAL